MQPDVVKDYKIFPNKIKESKPYIIKFDKNDIIKPKTYLLDCAVGNNYWQPIIIITYNNCIFFANNSI